MAKSNRMAQHSFTGKIRPILRLVSMTENPVGTIFALWYGSRHKDTVSAEIIQKIYLGTPIISEKEADIRKMTAEMICRDYPEHAGKDGKDAKNVIYKIVSQVIKADLPPTESVSFNFEVDHASIAWREQLVRGRTAGYWTQTSRTQDLSTMDVTMNDSVELLGGEEAVKIYQDTVDTIRKAYETLTALGVPAEDIRLQPSAGTHRVYWMIKLRDLIKIINKRSDWIAQASLWTPIIAGICQVLREKGLMDIIKDYVGKPFATVEYYSDFDKYVVTAHSQDTENEDRYYGRDPLPVDPLYLAYKHLSMPESTNLAFYDYMKSMFIQIWSDEYLDVLGWDREHPEKLGKYDRPEKVQ